MKKSAVEIDPEQLRVVLAAQGLSKEQIEATFAGLRPTASPPAAPRARASRKSAISQGPGAAAAGGSVAIEGSVHGDVHLGLSEKSADSKVAALESAYLSHLFAEVSRVNLSQIDTSVEGSDPLARFELQAVYTELLTRTPRSRPGRSERDRSEEFRMERDGRLFSALELLDRQDRLVLLGQPGSGKSTFVHFVALCQAGELLGSREANREILTTPLSGEKKRQPWRHKTLVPVRVILRDFAADGLPATGEPATADHVWRFIAADLAAQGLEDYAGPLRERLLDHGGLVFFDGLDEVPDAEGRRLQIREAVESFAGLYRKCRILVTSRVFSYRQQGWGLEGFEEAELAPFSRAQIELFVRRWYAHAASRGRGSAEDAEARAQELIREILGSARLRSFAERPLLLTLMASLARARGRGLPDRLAKLYEQVVELLLDLWECVRYQKKGDGQYRLLQPSLSDWLKTDRDDVRFLLEDLAFDAHAAQESPEGTADIAEKDLVAGLIGLARSGEVSQKRLVEFLSERSGLLMARGVGVYTLPHRTFQEYLAACHLNRGNFPDEVAELGRKDPDRWREVVLLAAAKAEEGTVASVWSLAQSLCPVGPSAPNLEEGDARGARLAGLVLADSARALPALKRQNVEPLERLQNWHLQMIGDERLAPAERAAAGRTLAALKDPRFDEERWYLPKEPLLGFVEIPAGRFRMGEGDEMHEVELPMFYIARWPVTVAQFRAFVQATGHEGFWAVFLARPGNEPVVGVNWHRALAYSEWLSDRLEEEAGRRAKAPGTKLGEEGFWGGLAGGRLRVTLPSEAEWEKAARGSDGRVYPWGEDYAAGLANDEKSGIGRPSAVGCFPRGASPFGVEDLAGNVWEWTRSELRPFPYVADDGREDLGDAPRRVLRGGAFLDEPRNVRCAFRNGREPVNRSVYIGFRVVVSPFRSDL